MLPHKRGSIKEAKVWAQALYLSWGSLLDAQWNPCLHCFSVSQQNSFWKGKTTACYTMWPLQSWSKGESQVTGRKLKTIIPISIFVLWKLRSWVASLCKGCDTSHVRPSSRGEKTDCWFCQFISVSLPKEVLVSLLVTSLSDWPAILLYGYHIKFLTSKCK